MAAADQEGDAIMADPAPAPAPAEEEAKAAPDAGDATPATASGDEAVAATTASDEPPGPSIEERVTIAEVAKEAGNTLLKSTDFEAAVAKYAEGIAMVEPEKIKDASEEELKQRGTAVYVALCLNSAQACIKLSKWTEASEHADRVLTVSPGNPKALYRRAVASMTFDSESRLEQARADLSQFVQIEPANREARDRLRQVKEQLKEAKQREKERFAQAMQGGLYQDNHRKLDRQKLEFDEEVKRRADAGEDEISWDDWQKKLKDRAEEDKKKEKEAREKRAKEAAEAEDQRLLHEENERRSAQGLEAMSLEEWQATQKNTPKQTEVVKMDETELDEEERKMLEETKSKGYYHGRLGTVLSDAAPKPELMREPSPNDKSPGRKQGGSEWNQAGTWEERDTSTWVKDRLTAWLSGASASGKSVTLPSGETTLSAEVSKVKSISGDAQIITVRKQPRFGYNFEAELSFRIRVKKGEDEEMPAAGEDGESANKSKASSQHFDGSFSLPELCDSVQPQDVRIEGGWKSRSPPENLNATALEVLQQLKESVRTQLTGFLREYHAL